MLIVQAKIRDGHLTFVVSADTNTLDQVIRAGSSWKPSRESADVLVNDELGDLTGEAGVRVQLRNGYWMFPDGHTALCSLGDVGRHLERLRA